MLLENTPGCRVEIGLGEATGYRKSLGTRVRVQVCDGEFGTGAITTGVERRGRIGTLGNGDTIPPMLVTIRAYGQTRNQNDPQAICDPDAITITLCPACH